MSKPIDKTDLIALQDAIQASFRTETRDLIEHFNRSQVEQNRRFDGIDGQLGEIRVELAAIKEMLVFRHELRALVRELKSHGIALDESRIFEAA